MYESYMKCDVGIWFAMWNNLVICGGSTMFPGMAARLNKEMMALGPRKGKIKIIDPGDAKSFLAWIGGSILSSLDTYSSMWITKEEFEAAGPGIVHRKCF